jgi:hypothetical protein
MPYAPSGSNMNRQTDRQTDMQYMKISGMRFMFILCHYLFIIPFNVIDGAILPCRNVYSVCEGLFSQIENCNIDPFSRNEKVSAGHKVSFRGKMILT